MTSKKSTNNETMNATMQVNNTMDPRDAIIIALCEKMGVDATALLKAPLSSPKGEDKPKGEKSAEGKEGKTITLKNKAGVSTSWPEGIDYKDGKYDMKAIDISQCDMYDVVVGIGAVRNRLTEVLMDGFGARPYSESLYVGKRPTDKDERTKAERISGYAINKRWSKVVADLIAGLKATAKTKQDDFIDQYLKDHADIVVAIRKWQKVAQKTTKTAKATKKELKAVFAAIAA